MAFINDASLFFRGKALIPDPGRSLSSFVARFAMAHLGGTLTKGAVKLIYNEQELADPVLQIYRIVPSPNQGAGARYKYIILYGILLAAVLGPVL